MVNHLLFDEEKFKIYHYGKSKQQRIWSDRS